MITTGKRYTPKEIERYVDSVTPEEIKRVAQKYLWDKDVSCFKISADDSKADVQFALAAVGRTEGLLDYNRIRAGESFFHYSGPDVPRLTIQTCRR
jgi:processing peptidase subunit beta